MSTASKELIAELQATRAFIGTCPRCDQEFSLADAVLFAIEDIPPEEALAAISATRKRIKERKEQLVADRERMTMRAQKTAHSVNLGKIVEKIVPSFSSFAHNAGDCRALFEPIDYLIFSGLTKSGRVDALLFVDVKSGSARLNNNQKNIKKIVETGAISFSNTAAS